MNRPLAIDAHRHLGVGIDTVDEAHAVLADMDHHGVAMTIIVPSDREIAVDNRAGNDSVISAAAAYPNRFAGMATVNPWYGKRGADELRRALDKGAVGLKLHPALQGFPLCHDVAHPLIEVARDSGVPVYVHTGTPPYAQPLQLAEVARTFTDVTFVMGHAGSTDLKEDVIPAAQLASNIVVETSWTLPARLEHLVASLGADRIMFGSDAPMSSLGIELSNHCAAVLSDTDLASVLHGTVQRVVGVSI